MARISVIVSIKLVVSYIVDIINYIFCRKKRRRKLSTDIPLSAVEIVPNHESQVTSDWDNWDNNYNSKPTTVNEHIQLYRMQKQEQYILQNNAEAVTEENPVDLFKDMEPEIIPQPAVVLKPTTENDYETNKSTRLFAYDAVPVKENELGTWDDEQNNWDTEIDDNVIRKEARKLDRERKMAENARKKIEKERAKPQMLITKIY